MNRLSLTVCLLFFGLVSFSQKIAVIDSDSVLKSMPEYDSIQGLLLEQGRKYQHIYDSLAIEFQKLYQEGLTISNRCISPSIQQEIERKLIIEQQSIFWFQNEGQRRILTLEKKLLKILETEFHRNTKQYLLEEGYDFMMERDSFIFIDAKYDMTQQVVKQLKERSEEVVLMVSLQLKKQTKYNNIKWMSNFHFIKRGLELELFQVINDGTLKYDLRIEPILKGCKDKMYSFFGF